MLNFYRYELGSVIFCKILFNILRKFSISFNSYEYHANSMTRQIFKTMELVIKIKVQFQFIEFKINQQKLFLRPIRLRKSILLRESAVHSTKGRKRKVLY